MNPFRKLLRPVRRWFDNTITSQGFRRYYADALNRCVNENESHAEFHAAGFELLRHHYYLSIPDEHDKSFIGDSDLVGLNIDETKCLEFFEERLAKSSREFRQFPVRQTEHADQYYIVNGSFMAIDGNIYYSLIRAFEPRRIIEIGSGNSTKLAATAVRRNIEEGKRNTELICVEPFHSDVLAGLDEVARVIPEYVQGVDMALFESLQAGDILFIDSTHTLRPGGDVWWEFCEILPRIAPGVFIHVHDVSLPKPYPSSYMDNHWYWMEQYFLQAFLAFNSRFRVLWPGNLLMQRYPEEMRSLFGYELEETRKAYPNSEPTSFWMQVSET